MNLSEELAQVIHEHACGCAHPKGMHQTGEHNLYGHVAEAALQRLSRQDVLEEFERRLCLSVMAEYGIKSTAQVRRVLHDMLTEED